jgi:hypothetical protein
MLPAFQRDMWKIIIILYVLKYVQSLAKARDFSLLCNILTSSGVNQVSYSVGSGTCFSRGKASST